MVKILVEVLALLSIGWLSGAEIGSWFGIQPIVERLPYPQQVTLEQAMLQSFGRVMPIIMPFSAFIVVVLAIFSLNDLPAVRWLRILAAICIGVTILTTLTINLPINTVTAKWDMGQDFEQWKQMRTRWHFFQGIRGGLFLVSFVLLALASTLQRA
jgi:hypothetical protein